MRFIMVAHGTRRPEGVAMIGDLAERSAALLRRKVRVAFVDVLGPDPTEVLAAAADAGEPAIILPAFLSRGFHVRIDLPTHIVASGHPDITVTPTLGPGYPVSRVVAALLIEAGWQPQDSVILAAAGTSDPSARAELRLASTLLSGLIGSRVTLAFAATGSPSVYEAVASSRRRGSRRVAVASYLLADGLFQQRLRDSGADLVSEPLGMHPLLARLVAERFSRASEGAEVRPT